MGFDAQLNCACRPTCIKIIVADDSEPLDEMPTSILELKLMASGVTLIRMPFDSGTAVGRNRLVSQSTQLQLFPRRRPHCPDVLPNMHSVTHRFAGHFL